MDLGEDEDFTFKHPYFFENVTFKFEGLNPETQENLENVVKRMGANIFDDAKYILTDILHASSEAKNYYSINYLFDSMKAKTPLTIEDYRFPNLVLSSNQLKFCCAKAKYIWKNKSCLSYYNENICCKSCMRIRGLQCDELSKESNNLCFDQVNGETNSSNIDVLNKEAQCANIDDLNEELQCDNIGDLNKESQCVNINELNKQISSLQVNNFDNDAMYDNFHENLDDFAGQSQTNGVSQVNGTNKNNSETSDMEVVEDSTEDPKDHQKPSCSTQRPKASKTYKQSIAKRKRVQKLSSYSDSSSENEDSRNSTKRPKISENNKSSTIDRWKKKRVTSSDSETSNKNDKSKKPTRKQKSKRQKLSSQSLTPVANKSSSDCEYIPSSAESLSNSSSNENFITRSNPPKEEWWLELPARDTTKRFGVGRKQDYDYQEKKIMLTYLIVNGLIDDGTSRKPWEKMRTDGYLRNRSTESLNNHFRKVLLPNIESFNLPRDIEERFIECRKCHIGRSRK